MEPTRLLCVEDDEDIREALVELLVAEGYDVAAVATAEEGLRALQTGSFDILLTDYNLPENDGGWLVRRAVATSHLPPSQIVVLTAERAPEGVDDHIVLRKPVDLDELLATLARLAPAPLEAVPPISVRATSDSAVLDLVLYITGKSLRSQKALRSLKRALKEYAPQGSINLTVCDVSLGDPSCMALLEEDGIIVTPTLVRKSPLPQMSIIGDLAANTLLDGLLRDGLERVRTTPGR